MAKLRGSSMTAKRRTCFRIRAIRIAAFLAASALTSWAQTSGSGQIITPGSPQSAAKSPFADGSLDEPPPRMSDSMRNKRNEDRQKRLTGDSQRLLVLANLLKSEVASSGVEAMTPDMLKQVDEIEKLARSVKDKMRN